jgi:Fe-S oxidoreductase
MTDRDSCSRCRLCERCCMVARAGGESVTTILCGDSETGAWNCANCWKCIETCPEGVDIQEIMMERRRQEPMPQRYKDAFNSIRRIGYVFPLEEVNVFREMWGLEPIKLVDPGKVRRLLGDTGDGGDEEPD